MDGDNPVVVLEPALVGPEMGIEVIEKGVVEGPVIVFFSPLGGLADKGLRSGPQKWEICLLGCSS